MSPYQLLGCRSVTLYEDARAKQVKHRRFCLCSFQPAFQLKAESKAPFPSDRMFCFKLTISNAPFALHPVSTKATNWTHEDLFTAIMMISSRPLHLLTILAVVLSSTNNAGTAFAVQTWTDVGGEAKSQLKHAVAGWPAWSMSTSANSGKLTAASAPIPTAKDVTTKLLSRIAQYRRCRTHRLSIEDPEQHNARQITLSIVTSKASPSVQSESSASTELGIFHPSGFLDALPESERACAADDIEDGKEAHTSDSRRMSMPAILRTTLGTGHVVMSKARRWSRDAANGAQYMVPRDAMQCWVFGFSSGVTSMLMLARWVQMRERAARRAWRGGHRAGESFGSCLDKSRLV
jgi:hypothetical protein